MTCLDELSDNAVPPLATDEFRLMVLFGAGSPIRMDALDARSVRPLPKVLAAIVGISAQDALDPAEQTGVFSAAG